MTLNGLMGLVVAGGVIVVALYWVMQRFVVPKVAKLREAKRPRKARVNMSAGESFAFLSASPYIRNLAMLVSERAAVGTEACPRGCASGLPRFTDHE